MPKHPNPLTPEQQADADLRGEIARVARQQHGASIVPWEVAGLPEVEGTEEDRRYAEMQRQWDDLWRDLTDGKLSGNAPLRAHGEVVAAKRRAWNFAWSLLEIEIDEYLFPGSDLAREVGELVSDISQVLRKMNSGSENIGAAMRRISQRLSPAIKGFGVDMQAECSRVDNLYMAAWNGYEDVYEYFDGSTSSMSRIRGMAVGMSELARDLGAPAETIEALYDLQRGDMMRASYLIESTLKTRKPWSFFDNETFLRPWKSFEVPAAIRWTKEKPKKGAREPRGYPVNKRGQFDSVEISRLAMKLGQWRNSLHVYRNESKTTIAAWLREGNMVSLTAKDDREIRARSLPLAQNVAFDLDMPEELKSGPFNGALYPLSLSWATLPAYLYDDLQGGEMHRVLRDMGYMHAEGWGRDEQMFAALIYLQKGKSEAAIQPIRRFIAGWREGVATSPELLREWLQMKGES